MQRPRQFVALAALSKNLGNRFCDELRVDKKVLAADGRDAVRLAGQADRTGAGRA